MTTSGTTTFNFNRDQIIKSALRKIGAIASGETPDAQTISDCSDQLNTLIKSLEATGLHVWTEAEAILFLQPNQIVYNFGTGSTDHVTESYTATTLAAAVAVGASSAVVTSATGIAATYNIGIVLDGGGIFWTTVNGTPVGTTVTLTAVATGSAAAGNAVYTYQTNIVRPLRVVSARRRYMVNQSNPIDTQMSVFSRIDYRNQPNKFTTGVITQWFYDPRGGANATGRMHVWPAPPDVTSALLFTWYRPIQDFSTPANNPDLPQEWLNALVWGLALEMAPEYDVPPQRFSMIEKRAGSAMENVMGWDREPESYLFGFSADQTAR